MLGEQVEVVATHGDDQRIVARAARAAGTAAAVFTYGEDGRERACGAACGGALAACAYVALLPWGAQACRVSRETAANRALRRGRVTPFICHLGFACVAAPVDAGQRDAIVFGPYLPADAPDPTALEMGVRAGLAALPQAHEVERAAGNPLPFSLDDLPLRCADSVAAVAEWAAESLRNARAAAAIATDDAAYSGIAVSRHKSRAGRRIPPVARDPYNGAAIAAAVAAGDAARVRRLLVAALAEPAIRPAAQSHATARARAAAVAAAVLEQAESAGLDTQAAWERWDAFQTRLAAATSAKERQDALGHLLRPLRHRHVYIPGDVAIPAGTDATIAALDACLAAHWTEPVSLDAAAAALGLKPATLTKRLQRALGLPFTQYVNRRRVEQAKHLLLHTNLSVKTIAKRVGVDDGANLARLFRRHEGMSPSQFRRRRKP